MELLDEIAPQEEISPRLVQKLLDTEWKHYGMRRRASIHDTIDRIFGEEWRTLNEILDSRGVERLEVMENDQALPDVDASTEVEILPNSGMQLFLVEAPRS
jgi:hypothetical protein